MTTIATELGKIEQAVRNIRGVKLTEVKGDTPQIMSYEVEHVDPERVSVRWNIQKLDDQEFDVLYYHESEREWKHSVNHYRRRAGQEPITFGDNLTTIGNLSKEGTWYFKIVWGGWESDVWTMEL